MRVVYPTTAAQYFHVLRRQVHDPDRKPLIVMTPKRYLRMPATRVARRRSSTTAASISCSPTPTPPAPSRSAARVLHRQVRPRAASPARDELHAPVAIVRLEQLYPWPEREIAASCSTAYPDAEVIWAQEEPGNMGARYFARRRIEELAGGRAVGVVARAASPSPATGSSTVHDARASQKLLEDALDACNYRPYAATNASMTRVDEGVVDRHVAHEVPVEDRSREAGRPRLRGRRRRAAHRARCARSSAAIVPARRWRTKSLVDVGRARDCGSRRRTIVRMHCPSTGSATSCAQVVQRRVQVAAQASPCRVSAQPSPPARTIDAATSSSFDG